MRPEADRENRYGRQVPGGTTTLVHIWISLAANRPMPRSLRHSLVISAEDGSRVEAVDARVDVQGPPLYVIIAAAGRAFVHYAHLQRNSVMVKTGQAVRRGQLLGRLGNSGNTNAAHLHFNVTDGPLAEGAQGVPFVVDAFEWLGSTTAGRARGAEPSAEVFKFSPSKRSQELTLDGAVARYR